MSNANPLQLLRSNTANKRPNPAGLADGRPAINTNSASPGLFFKDSAGALVKVGPVHVGTTAPNASPASGGSAGNSVGEQWLDTTGGTYVFKVWDGSAWRSESGTFVDVNGDVMTGALGIIAGSASAPGLYFSGDTNTGLYSPGSDQLALATGGTGRLFVDASGFVGVGTSSPQATLHANGAILSSGALSALSASNIFFDQPTSALSRIGIVGANTSTAGTLRISQYSSDGSVGRDVFSINDQGRVGIGTTSPGSPLTIESSAGNQVKITYPSIASYFLNATSGGDFAINKDGTERLRITSAGLVGVGTSSPNYQLHVTTDFAVGASGFNQQLTFSNDTIQSLLLGTGYTALKLNPLGGNVGIGTTSPGATLDVSGTVNFKPAAGYNALFQQSSTTLRINYLNDAGSANVSATYRATDFAWQKGDGNDVARIDSSGRLLVGTSSARSNIYNTTYAPQIQLEGNDNSNSALSIISCFNGNSIGGQLILGKANSGSVGANGIVGSGNSLGRLSFQGNDGSEFVEGAAITAEVDGTPGANDMPGRLVFSTTADGASSPTERMRITNNGGIYCNGKIGDSIGIVGVGFSGASPGNGTFTASDIPLLTVNRKASDGTLVEFYQDEALEGTISVSGTTVSYNGAHLSRWSQLPSGQERAEILRGTILSNIDEMCEWNEEENEQLNRMKVSDVEGDKNVAGVFQAWDDDDDTYTTDFYCAMTGDFIIRIGAGITVERGDLLMSAGDGTAKPQDDDIIRSKTIAKVTSTNVSCTYDDGSYCVPCVLMAC